MSLASPAKQHRVERHLSRQRGAGVRTVTASFGFTFGLGTPQFNEVSRPAEPAAKYRKSEEGDVTQGKRHTTCARDDEATSTSEPQPKARRRFESVEEQLLAQSKAAAQDVSFVALKKTTKRRGTAKVVKEPTTPSALPPAPVQDEEPSRRPRRQAATAAISKVSKGFIEEEQPIDKMRRGQEAVPPKRRTIKKAKATTMTKADSHDIQDKHLSTSATAVTLDKRMGDSGIETEIKQEPRRRKRKEVAQNKATSNLSLDQDSKATSLRVPLAETTNNPIRGSAPPEKSLKVSNEHLSATRPQTSPAREKSPTRPTLINSNDAPRGKRQPLKFAVSRDIPAMEADVEIGTTAPDSQEHSESTKTQQSRRRMKKEEVMGVDVQSSLNADCAAKQLKSKIEHPTMKPERARSAKKGAVSTNSAPRNQPLGEGEDVDWLFDESRASKRVPSRKPKGAAKCFKKSGELPDVDLDDLLSNIATFAPPRAQHTARSGGPRR